MLRFLKISAAFVVVVALAIILAQIMFAIPVGEGRHDTVALLPPQTGTLASRAARNVPGLTGVVPLGGGADAFAARILLADAAERYAAFLGREPRLVLAS